MPRALALSLAVLLVAALAGCGSSPHRASGPLATELSYLPAGGPLVAAVNTDPQGRAVQNAEALVGALPLGKLGITAVESLLSSRGIGYATELEPLFGNPIVLAASPQASSRFVAAWIPRSSVKLGVLLRGEAAFRPIGHARGAALYRVDGLTMALSGGTVILGPSPAVVKAAMSRHAHGGGMTATAFELALASLPSDALVQVEGDLAGVLDGSRLAKVPWFGAVRGYGATLSASSAGLSVHFRLDTSGAVLTGAQLPLASGAGAPALAGTLPIELGLRDPAHTAAFLQDALGTADPHVHARFRRSAPGRALTALGSLLTGALNLESNGRTTIARAAVSDPARAARLLARARAGARGIDLELVGRELVAGARATSAQLRAFATAGATSVPGTAGSLALRMTPAAVLRLALGQAPPTLVASFLSILGDVTGSATTRPGAVIGRLSLGVDSGVPAAPGRRPSSGAH